MAGPGTRKWATVPEPSGREPGAAYIDAAGPREAYERAVAVYVNGVRFVKPEAVVPSCTLELVDEGRPESTYRCSACGKLHTASRAHRHCPRCGARNASPDRADANVLPRPSGGWYGGETGSETPDGQTGPSRRSDTAQTTN